MGRLCDSSCLIRDKKGIVNADSTILFFLKCIYLFGFFFAQTVQFNYKMVWLILPY